MWHEAIQKFRLQVRMRPLLRDAVTTTFWITIGKGAGFLIPFFIAAWFGVGPGTDAFFFAYGLILFLSTIFSAAVETIIVPFIAESRVRHEDVGAFVGSILMVSGLFLALITAIFLLTIKSTLGIVTRFSTDDIHLVFQILLETSPLTILLVWTSILSGAMNAYKIFSVPAFSPAFRAVITLGIIFYLKGTMGVHAIAWGYVVGEAARLIMLFVIIRETQLFRFRFALSYKPEFIVFLKTAASLLAGMTLLSCAPIINKAMASWLGTGNVSLLEYADRLYMIPTTLLNSGLIVALLSHWSERYQKEGEERLRHDLMRAVKIVIILCLFLTAVLYGTRNFLVQIVYGHGQFPQERLSEVSDIFVCLIVGLTPFFICQLYVRAFLAKKNTRVFLLAAVYTIIATVLFNLILLRIMGITGIALAGSLATFVPLGTLSYLFHRRAP